jgi:hypothetical protein
VRRRSLALADYLLRNVHLAQHRLRLLQQRPIRIRLVLQEYGGGGAHLLKVIGIVVVTTNRREQA